MRSITIANIFAELALLEAGLVTASTERNAHLDPSGKNNTYKNHYLRSRSFKERDLSADGDVLYGRFIVARSGTGEEADGWLKYRTQKIVTWITEEEAWLHGFLGSIFAFAPYTKNVWILESMEKI